MEGIKVGRTWNVKLGNRDIVGIASAYFKYLPRFAPVRGARATNVIPAKQENLGSDYDSDGNASSIGSEAEERRAEGSSKRKNTEDDWELCTVLEDVRDVSKVTVRRSGLKRRLREGEEPIFGLFGRFSPVHYCTNRLEAESAHYNE